MTRLASQPDRLNVGSAEPIRPLVEEVPWVDSIEDLFQAVVKGPFTLFLDSARTDQHGRYSYLAWNPFESIESRDGIVCAADDTGDVLFEGKADPFEVLRTRLSRFVMIPNETAPPFQGGAAGLFAYELCHHLERLPRPHSDEFAVPDMCVGLYAFVVAFDHVERRAWVVATGLPHRGAERRAAAMRQLDYVRRVVTKSYKGDLLKQYWELAGQWPANLPQCYLANNGGLRLAPQHSVKAADCPITSNFSRDDYLRTVERAIEYIHAGDVYQVNVAQRLLAPLTTFPAELYVRLRQHNPAPFAAYFNLGLDFAIASASPERFLRVHDREVETRPIKGTRPRWPMPEADMLSGLELLESDKDRAENVMIVDLLRNDLGRVCEFGSVRVADPLRLESFEFVHHLVSEVHGRLRPECGPIDLVRAAFPGGSVTGAPKIRAMEIIAELEPTARGPYCGSLGYIGFDGSMDTSILIRTFTCGRGWVQFPVGGGIVADSSPEREYEETLHKAEGMMRALKLNG